MMKAVAVFAILVTANAIDGSIDGTPTGNQLVETEKPGKKGLLSKAADVVQKSATATAAAAAISRMADQLDGKTTQSNIVNPVSSIVKKHDKAQIAKLKQQGRISEGFPDLAFVHIPKTGGDAISMASTPIFPYGFGLRANLALNLMVDKKKQGNNFCYFEQLPPKEIAKLYSKKVSEEAYGKRTVFCAVRNPYERIVSEWHSCRELNSGRCGNQCDADSLNSFVQTELLAYQKGDYLRGECQFIPQTDYMQGEGGCTKLLDYDHLERDFNELMQSHGYNLTLPAKPAGTKLTGCQASITSANLTASSRKYINKVYQKDFDEIGPEFGWVEQSTVEKVKKFLMAPFNALTSTYAQVGEATSSLFADLPKPDEGHRD